MGNSIYLGGGIKSAFCGGNVKEIWQGSNKIFGGGGKIDDDIVVLFDGVSNYGFQPNEGTTKPKISYDVNGPLDVSGTGWSGTPYFSNDLSTSILWSQDEVLGLYNDRGKNLTIEYWAKTYRFFSSNSPQPMFWQEDGNMWCVGASVSTNYSSPMIWINDKSSTFSAIDISKWHHYAITIEYKNENIFDLKFFIDGILYGSINSKYFTKYANYFFIAKNTLTGTNRSSQYFSQVVLRNSCKWTENFTPPTKPYILGV